MPNPASSQTLNTMNMQQFSKWLGIPLLLAALAAGGFFLGRITTDETATVARHEMSIAEGERNVLYWQAPMDPTEMYDRPGKSAMGMDLDTRLRGRSRSGIG